MATGTLLTNRLLADVDLLHRHIAVLRAVEEHQPIGIMRLARLLGHPRHHVRYTLRILEEEGLVRPSQAGAFPTKKVKSFHKELRDVMNEMKKTVETLKNSL